VFKNTTQQGDFGEYLYIEFCKKNKIDCDRVNRLGRDIDLANAKIDVKTSKNQKNWGDKKYKPYVKYDVIFIDKDDDSVYLYPEKDSPLRKDFYGFKLGEFADLYDEWKTSKYEVKDKFDLIEYERKEFLQRVSKNFRLRQLLYRVDTHKWIGYPDNIPGSWEKYDATIFLRIKFDWEKDKIGEIKYYLFLSHEMDLYPDAKPTKRQRKKGIKRIIDLEEFEKTFPRNIFTNRDKLISDINSMQS
jgi:hypothetical protein